MSLEDIELACAEDESSILDERLQTELIMRKKILQSRTAQQDNRKKKGSGLWTWILVAILASGLMAMLATHRQAPNQVSRQEKDTEMPLPGK